MRQGAIIAAMRCCGLASATGAAAQNYPERVVQIIVPATPGSSADILGRVLADGMSAQFGKPVIVVNKPGANGVLGTADVARAKADGYMLMHGATYSITVQPLTDKDAGYTVKSFTPICQTFKNDQVIVVPPNSPLKTAKDIIEAAKQKPGALNVGIPGIATIPHLAMIQLAQQAKVEFNDVPFKGPAEEIQNTRSGQLDFSAVPLTAAAGSGLGDARTIRGDAQSVAARRADFQGAGLRRGAAELRRPARSGRDAGGRHAQARKRLHRHHEKRCRPARGQEHVPAGGLFRRRRGLCPQSRDRRRRENAAGGIAQAAMNVSRFQASRWRRGSTSQIKPPTGPAATEST